MSSALPVGLQLASIVAMVILAVVACTTLYLALGESLGNTGPTGLSRTGDTGPQGAPGEAVLESSTGSTGPTGPTGPPGEPNPDSINYPGPTGGGGPDGATGSTGHQGPPGAPQFTTHFAVVELRSGGQVLGSSPGPVALVKGPYSAEFEAAVGVWMATPIVLQANPLPPNGPLTFEMPLPLPNPDPFVNIRAGWPVNVGIGNRSVSAQGKHLIGRAVPGPQMTIELLLTDPAGILPPVPMQMDDMMNPPGVISSVGSIVMAYYPTE